MRFGVHQNFPRFAGVLTGFLLLAASLPAVLRAAEIQPPLQALRHPNYTLIVAQPVNAGEAEDRLAVRVLERLKGDVTVPEEIELLLNPGDSRYLRNGARYLLYYSDVERVSFKPRTEVRRPDRRLLLHIEGAGPAVFPDTPEMRALLSPDHAAVEQGPGYRDIVVAGLHSDSPAMVDLWSAEWALRPATFSRIEPGEAERLRQIVEDPGQRAAARSRILITAPNRISANPEAGGAPWFVQGAISVLEHTEPAELTPETGLSQLIYACLQLIRDHPEDWQASLLDRWLRSTPPLAENAAIALRAIDPAVEREAVRAAISDPGTPELTRNQLEDHLRRLQRVEGSPTTAEF